MYYSRDAGADIALLANTLLKIFPVGDFGIELTKATLRIFLYGATCLEHTEIDFGYLFFLSLLLDRNTYTCSFC